MESPISSAQTDEMRDHRIQLVIPRTLHEPYKPVQRQWLMTIHEFISMTRERDRQGPSQTKLL